MKERKWIEWREQIEKTAKNDSASFRSRYLTLIERLATHGLAAVRYHATAGAFLRELVGDGTITEGELRGIQLKYVRGRDRGEIKKELIEWPIVLKEWEELSPSDAAILRSYGRMGIEHIEGYGFESLCRQPWAKKFDQAVLRDAIDGLAYAVGLAQQGYLKRIGEAS